jgi:hypothetical protein
MWSETPDLMNDSGNLSVAFNPVKFGNKKPAVNMWAETPDINADKENYDLSIETGIHLSGNINPELYAETPDMTAVYVENQIQSAKSMQVALAR